MEKMLPLVLGKLLLLPTDFELDFHLMSVWPYWFCIRFPCNVWIAMLVSDALVFATGAAVCEVLANALCPLNNIIARRLR